ncbi:MAG: chromate transporter [Burkholderiales bacterium]
MNWELALLLAWELAQMSLFAVGGATSVVPDLHRRIVESHGWASNAQFSEMVGLAQAAPGPNMLLVSLIGWKIAEFPGALAAFVGMCAPSSLFVFSLMRFWERHRNRRWNKALTAALAPIAVGLTLASGYLVTLGAGSSVAAFVFIGITAAAILFTKMHPIWFIGIGATAGLAGWI